MTAVGQRRDSARTGVWIRSGEQDEQGTGIEGKEASMLRPGLRGIPRPVDDRQCAPGRREFAAGRFPAKNRAGRDRTPTVIRPAPYSKCGIRNVCQWRSGLVAVICPGCLAAGFSADGSGSAHSFGGARIGGAVADSCCRGRSRSSGRSRSRAHATPGPRAPPPPRGGPRGSASSSRRTPRSSGSAMTNATFRRRRRARPDLAWGHPETPQEVPSHEHIRTPRSATRRDRCLP